MTSCSFSATRSAPARAAASGRCGGDPASAPGGAARRAWAGFPTTTEASQELAERAEELLLTAFPGSTLEFEERVDDEPRWMLFRAYWPVDRRWDQKWIWCRPSEAAPLMRKWWE